MNSPHHAEASSSPPIPKRIGPYTIEGLYRVGGMSLLYLASHPVTQDPIIIKVLKPHLRSKPEILKKFDNEARILKIADHPNIVRLYDYEQSSEGPYIALEFIQGQSLHSIIEHNPVPLKRAVEIILEIAYALCHLHTLGVIHRDLKPENILVTDQDTIKLIDLGVAQMISEPETGHPQKLHKKQVVGTPIYMSPEQHSNPDSVSYASDIYSLGIITYELVLGKLSHGQIHLAIMPKGLQKIIAKTLQPKIGDRYQDVVDFITDLSAYLNSEKVEKERKGADQLTQLSLNLQQAQILLLPAQAPQWPNIDIGIALYRGLGIGGIYYDFFPLPEERFGIVLGEPSLKGVEGVIYTALLRGMWRTLVRLTNKPTSLVTFLNDMIVRDMPDKKFYLTFLIVSPQENQLSYICCGPSKAWLRKLGEKQPEQLPTNNPALGVQLIPEFKETTLEWHVGDTLYMHTEALSSAQKGEAAFEDGTFRQALISVADLPPQKLCDAIIRKATSGEPSPNDRRTICLITLKRLSTKTQAYPPL